MRFYEDEDGVSYDCTHSEAVALVGLGVFAACGIVWALITVGVEAARWLAR